MTASAEWPVERYRGLLHALARRVELDPRFHRRFSVSDIVQETLLKAHQHRGQFRGSTEAELVRWLQRILANTLRDEMRKAGAAMRDQGLERSLQQALHDSSALLAANLAVEQPSPSAQAERREQLARMGDALQGLPEAQRDAVILHYLMGDSVTGIAQKLACTNKAVAGLLYRGLKRLREELSDS
jgi:RNA polymerase sigma-70 factor (ECF subfamily)